MLSTQAVLDTVGRDLPAKAVENPWPRTPASEQARRAALARHERPRASGRGEPATSDRAYSTAEVEFMNAMQSYKQSSGRMFPTWSEVLEVLTSLGYRKAGTEEVRRRALQIAAV